MKSVSLLQRTLFIKFLLVKGIMTHMIGSLPTTGLIVCKVWVIRLEHEERAFIKKNRIPSPSPEVTGKVGQGR